MKGQKLKKKKRHKTHHQLQKPLAKLDKKDAFIMLKPCFSLTYSDVFFVFSLIALAIHMKHCLSYAQFYFYPVKLQSIGISTGFQASN